MVAWFLAAEFIGLNLSNYPPYLTRQPNDFASMLEISNQMPGRDTFEMQDPETCAPCRFERRVQYKLRPFPHVALEHSYS